MSKKSFFVILVLSVILTYGVAFIEGVVGGHFLSYGGVPFKFTSGSLSGSSTDYRMLLLDIIFWFGVVWLLWKAIQKIFKK